ncbi:DnaB-like dsDNA helicase [Mycobacterium phage Chupacabra]|uniref:DnaB-like dsDNA helicase n=3 Tax=Fromanvirus goose TaxID=1211282 RepID=A0A291AV06_9CAUD|nr:DnaB-like replicative helicase [Mycobacterium phage Goose]AFU20687.1 DnaB-like dsDNA helicase [Mycobacterium phage Goose]ATE84803.1 DnaB-like dsDNA helicase [Mycobacterium phage OKCentral2016]QHB41244.1 DnaB-like dsDNA helicase [Mycobacterium phage Chupacabra]
MYTPLQSLRVKGSAGDPLPTVFESLEMKGTRFLRGQLALVCAGPGTGKSAFVLTYALKAAVPTLYFSADSDAFTQLSRMISIQTGWSLERASRAVRNSDLSEVEEEFEDIPIRFNYNASPSLDQIEHSMKAYCQGYGDYPDLVVVDNITNIRLGTEDDDPFSGLESLMDYLHDMARRTSACVIGLHHVTGSYNDADKPIPLSGVKGQITRVPELVLTLHRVSEEFGPETLNVSTVKNRAGRMDPSGMDFVSLEFIGDTMQIRDQS